MGVFTAATMSYMLKHSKFPFEALLKAAVCCLFEIYQPKIISIVMDDTDRHRTKAVKAIAFVFKTICKMTKGYVLAQNVVFVCLVTDRFTIPVAWAFYSPDPVLKKWESEIKKLKKLSVPKSKYPKKPQRSIDYPTRIDICEDLLLDVKDLLNDIKSYLRMRLPNYPDNLYIHAVVADAAYMSPEMCGYVRKIFGVNFISQLKLNQLVLINGREVRLDNYFKEVIKTKSTMKIRNTSVEVEYAVANLHVKSHGRALRVIVIRYRGESSWRYTASTDLTWRPLDIIRAYGLRWLIETFNEDWKQYGGWGKKALQQGDEGSFRGVILSLLVDYFFLWHPIQVRLHQLGQPLCTTGSLQERISVGEVTRAIETTLAQPNPEQHLEWIKEKIEVLFKLTSSTKHAAGGLGFAYPTLEDNDPGGQLTKSAA